MDCHFRSLIDVVDIQKLNMIYNKCSLYAKIYSIYAIFYIIILFSRYLNYCVYKRKFLFGRLFNFKSILGDNICEVPSDSTSRIHSCPIFFNRAIEPRPLQDQVASAIVESICYIDVVPVQQSCFRVIS